MFELIFLIAGLCVQNGYKGVCEVHLKLFFFFISCTHLLSLYFSGSLVMSQQSLGEDEDTPWKVSSSIIQPQFMDIIISR